MSAFHNTSSDRQQSARHSPQGRFSLEGAILIVDTEEDAHAAREHLGMEAFVFGSFLPAALMGPPLLSAQSCRMQCSSTDALLCLRAPRAKLMLVWNTAQKKKQYRN
jgi:hypothetical protein